MAKPGIKIADDLINQLIENRNTSTSNPEEILQNALKKAKSLTNSSITSGGLFKYNMRNLQRQSTLEDAISLTPIKSF